MPGADSVLFFPIGLLFFVLITPFSLYSVPLLAISNNCENGKVDARIILCHYKHMNPCIVHFALCSLRYARCNCSRFYSPRSDKSFSALIYNSWVSIEQESSPIASFSGMTFLCYLARKTLRVRKNKPKNKIK